MLLAEGRGEKDAFARPRKEVQQFIKRLEYSPL